MALHQGTFVVFLLLAVATFSRSHPLTINTGNRAENKDYRLSNVFVPESYDIALTIPAKFETVKTFEGLVKITLYLPETPPPPPTPTKDETKQDKSKITLHMKDMKQKLTKADVKLYKSGVTENLLKDEDPVENTDTQMVTFAVKKPEDLKEKETYVLEIKFQGQLHEDMKGFYLSSYEENDKKEWIAATQFQPTHARRAFPCFDEPNLKATFDISITHPKGYHALGNTEGTETVIPGDDKNMKTTFETTPKMSTYLVAFVVHQKFASMHSYADDISNAVWSQNELVGRADYAFKMAPKILNIMKEFTGVAYSVSKLTKLDQVAIPDFSPGAMENWGLVTYREAFLIWDAAESTAQSKQRVAGAVAHELSHMWFGNLITLDWWSSTWLNEGFARYFQYVATAKVETDWDLMNQFVVERQQSAFAADSLTTSQALTSDVFTPDQISSKFDTLTYNKGASMARMMGHFMEEENFFKGIKDYFKEETGHHFGNVQPKDLWAAMSKHAKNSLPAGVTLEQVMKGWTENPGYPVITVTSKEKTVTLEAERFLFDGKKQPSTWYIPISYTTSTKPKFTDTSPAEWMEPDEKLNIKFELTDDSWIIFNIQSAAYARINYDEALWKGIQKALQTKHDDIHVVNRAQIVDDSMNLARAGRTPYSTALNVLLYLENEIDYYPWYSAFNAFAYLRRRIDSGDELASYLNRHISNLMRKLYESAPFDSKPQKQVDILKKVLTQNWASELEHAEVVEKSKEQFKLFKENNVPVDPDLRSVVYCTALRHSEDEEDWKFLRKRATETRLASEAATILTALGCTKDEQLLKSYLKQSIDPASDIRRQDAQLVFTAVISGNPEGIPIGLDFLTKNYDEIRKNYGGLNALATVITTLADRLTTEDQVKDFKKFVTSAELGEAQKAADNAVRTCEANLAWVDTYKEDLLKHLKEIVEGPTTPPVTTEGTTTPGGATSVSVSAAAFILSILAILNRW